jgi:DNA-binding MarR family transcriptional regulator
MLQAEQVTRAHSSFVEVVRALGLLRPDTTPCGQPISITEAHAIGELHAVGPLTQQDLAQRLRLQKSTVSRLVNQLDRGGLTKRTPNPADARSVLVRLTRKGNTRAVRLEAARQQLFSALLDTRTAAERCRITDGLELLQQAAHDIE